jgi:hypothetical protein
MDIERLAGTKLGNYEIECLLGRGGMGVIYKVLGFSIFGTEGSEPIGERLVNPEGRRQEGRRHQADNPTTDGFGKAQY